MKVRGLCEFFRFQLFASSFGAILLLLRIKAFYGTCENAVKPKLGMDLSIYVLVAIVKRQLGLDLSMHKILQILSVTVTVFEKTPILEGFSNFSDEITDTEPCIQLNLFDF